MGRKVQPNVFRTAIREDWYVQSYTPEYRRDIRILFVISRFLNSLCLQLGYDSVGLSLGLCGRFLRVLLCIGTPILPPRMRWRLNRMGAAFGGAVTYLGITPAFYQRFMLVGWASVVGRKLGRVQLDRLADIYGMSERRMFGITRRMDFHESVSSLLQSWHYKNIFRSGRNQKKCTGFVKSVRPQVIKSVGGFYLGHRMLTGLTLRRRVGWSGYAAAVSSLYFLFMRDVSGKLRGFGPDVYSGQFGLYGLLFLFTRRFISWLSAICSTYTGYRTFCEIVLVGDLDIKYRQYAKRWARNAAFLSDFAVRRRRGFSMVDHWDYILSLFRVACFFFNVKALLGFLVLHFGRVAKSQHYLYLNRMVLLFRQLVSDFFIIKSTVLLVAGRIGGSRRKRIFRSGGIDKFSSSRVTRSEATSSVVYCGQVSNTELGSFYFRLWVEYSGRFFSQARFRRAFKSRYAVANIHRSVVSSFGSQIYCFDLAVFGVFLPLGLLGVKTTGRSFCRWTCRGLVRYLGYSARSVGYFNCVRLFFFSMGLVEW